MRKTIILFMVLLGSCYVFAQSVFVQRGITYRYNGKNPRMPICLLVLMRMKLISLLRCLLLTYSYG